MKFVDRPWEPVDHQLAETMSSYWANFIKTGDPNGARLPGWPHYGIGEKQIILLGDQVEATPLPDAEALDFMQSLLGQPIPAASR